MKLKSKRRNGNKMKESRGEWLLYLWKKNLKKVEGIDSWENKIM